MIRELTSVVVFLYTLLLLWAMWTAADAESFSAFYQFLDSPLSVWLHGVVLLLTLYHTGTWISLTPKVLVLWRDDEQVDPNAIAGVTAILFVLLSGVVLWLILT